MTVITKITIVPPTTPIFPASISDLLSRGEGGAVKKAGVAVNTDRHCPELFLQARELPQDRRGDI